MVVAGCRTPFAKAGTAFRDISAVELGKVSVRELIDYLLNGRMPALAQPI